MGSSGKRTKWRREGKARQKGKEKVSKARSFQAECVEYRIHHPNHTLRIDCTSLIRTVYVNHW
mgnify:CR=1 FL=1